MSLRPTGLPPPRALGNNDDRRIGQQLVNTPQQSPRVMPSLPPIEPRSDVPGSVGAALTPLSQASDSSPPIAERRVNRSLGMSSILNPQPSYDSFPQGRRRSAAQMESPSPVESLAIPTLPPISRRSNDQALGEEERPLPGPPRRILSPRSPSLHGRYNTINYGPPTGSIDTHAAPFLPNSGAGPQRGISINTNVGATQSIPTPPAQFPHQSYFHNRSAPTPPPASLLEARRPSLNTMSSRNVSPTSVASTPFGPGHHPLSLSLPPTRHPTPQSGVPMPRPSHIQLESGAPSLGSQVRMEASHQYGIPIVPNGSGPIQMMAIQTQSGEIHIPVDTTAGSRAADEKRKRNAGASARFRQRRKEKEREASTTIDQLRQQLRDAEEDSAFYRNERDALRDIVAQSPEGHRHFPRPQSPRLSRQRPIVHSEDSSPHPSEDQASSYDPLPEHMTDTERNVRRRTSSYVPDGSSSNPIMPSATSTTPIPGSVGHQPLPTLQPSQSRQGGLQAPYRQMSPRRVVSHDPFMDRQRNYWVQAPPNYEKPQ